jgi:DNA polymerase-3 subunit alpha/error-prone DNA polymerase
MAKLPFIADPRFADGNDVPENKDLLKTDVSTTHRAPYPSTHEIGLPRYKMGGK